MKQLNLRVFFGNERKKKIIKNYMNFANYLTHSFMEINDFFYKIKG